MLSHYMPCVSVRGVHYVSGLRDMFAVPDRRKHDRTRCDGPNRLPLSGWITRGRPLAGKLLL